MQAQIAFPPGPKGNLILGNLLQMRQGFSSLIRESLEVYGDIVHFRIGLSHIYVVNNPDYIQEVLVKQASDFYKTKLVKRVLGKTFGNGIIVSDGDFHRRQRRLVQPALHTRRINAYGEIMVDYALRMISQWENGQEVNLHEEMTDLTMEIVAATLFGTNVEEVTATVRESLTTIVEIANSQLKQSLFRAPDWIPTKRNREEKAAIQALDEILAKMIAERRGSAEDKGDLLSMLLLATDDEVDGGKMTDRQARDEAMTLFLGGHETTSIALTWLWYFLSIYPEIESKVLEEIDSVIGDALPTVKDIAEFKYMDMVIKEALRFYPPVWIFNRECVEDVMVGGYRIPKGSTVFICPYIIHHDERYFEEPESFLPERFSEGYDQRIPRYAYFPFGGGPRVCIGQMFALMEIKLVLASVLPKYRMTAVEGQEVQPKTSATLRPRQDILMRVERRN